MNRTRSSLVMLFASAVSVVAATGAHADGPSQLRVVQGASVSTYNSDYANEISRCTSDDANTLSFSQSRQGVRATVNQPDLLPGTADWGASTIALSGSASGGRLSNKHHFGPGDVLDGNGDRLATAIPYAEITQASATLEISSSAGRATVVMTPDSRRFNYIQCADWTDADVSRLNGEPGAQSGWASTVIMYVTFEARVVPSAGFGRPQVERGRGWVSISQLHTGRPGFGYGASAGDVILFTDGASSEPLDSTAPVVSSEAVPAANSNGWNNTPVQITWTASDPAPSSGQPSPSSALTTVTTEGAGQQVGGPEFCDAAGNCARGARTVNVDTTAPTLAITGITDGTSYVTGEPVPPPNCIATDSLSGLAEPCQAASNQPNPRQVGAWRVSSSALDRAGNRSTKSVRYDVRYAFSGFLLPLNLGQLLTYVPSNQFIAGLPVPIRFRLSDADGRAASPSTPPRWLTPAAPSSTQATTTSGSFTRVGTEWVYLWIPPRSMAGSAWRIGTELDDGHRYTVDVRLY